MALDLTPFTAELGDPSKYFAVEGVREHALVFDHETGEPRFAVAGGKLTPYADYVAGLKAPAGPPASVSLGQAGDAGFKFEVAVTPPPEAAPVVAAEPTPIAVATPTPTV